MLGLSSMPSHVSGKDGVCLFVAFSYTPMEATVLSCCFGRVWCSMPKVHWNNKSPLSLKKLSDFVDFLQVVICILLDIHLTYKNILFWAGIVRHRLSAYQIVRCFKLKKLKIIWDIKLIFCFCWSYKKYAILSCDSTILLANQFSGVFNFDLFDLLILIQVVHCYIVLIFPTFARYLAPLEYLIWRR